MIADLGAGMLINLKYVMQLHFRSDAGSEGFGNMYLLWEGGQVAKYRITDELWAEIKRSWLKDGKS